MNDIVGLLSCSKMAEGLGIRAFVRDVKQLSQNSTNYPVSSDIFPSEKFKELVK